MSKIKFRLEKFERALVFQVLEMDERFRYDDSRIGCIKFKAKNDFSIISSYHPKASVDKIFLRGNAKSEDYTVCVINFATNNDRDKYHKLFIEAIKDWADNWEGWGETESIKESSDGIFEF